MNEKIVTSQAELDAIPVDYNGRIIIKFGTPYNRPIAYKNMQVDHFRPLRAWDTEDAGTDDISNLMPACRMCNHYKRANSIETFRRYIREIPQKLRSNYIYKVGLAYGNVMEREKPIVFYFELF